MTLFAALALPIELAAQRTNGLIAFTQLTNGTDGPATVFIANPDGSNVQQVQLPPDDPAETLGVPIWSPDGSTLLISHTFRCDSSGNCFFQPATVDPSGTNSQPDAGCQVDRQGPGHGRRVRLQREGSRTHP